MASRALPKLKSPYILDPSELISVLTPAKTETSAHA